MAIIKKEIKTLADAFVALGEGWHVQIGEGWDVQTMYESYHLVDNITLYYNGQKTPVLDSMYAFSFPTIAWKKQPWYENIPSKGIWCKISNNAGTHIVLIKSTFLDDEMFRVFIDDFDEGYDYAIPVSKEEMMEYFD